MKTSKRILYFVAFVTTAFYLTWRLVATIPWHDSWFALIFRSEERRVGKEC